MNWFLLTPPPAPAGAVGDESRTQRIKRELRVITYAWIFGSLWLWTINGATMTRFAKSLATPDWAFGVMAALPFAGTLFQLPASYILERYGHRRTVFLWLATIHRLVWVAVAAIPWIFPDIGPLRWHAMIALLLVGWATGSATGPAWMSWMADVIPRRIRGRYFGIRNRIGQFMGVLTTFGIGLVLNSAEQHELLHPGTMLKITSAILALAGLFGALDIQAFSRVRDDYHHKPQPGEHWFASLHDALANPHFRWYLGFNFTITLGTAYVGQYVWLYALNHIGMSSMQANLLIIAFPLLVMMTSYPIWGRLMDRLGKKPVLIIASSCVVCGSIGWVFLGKDVAVNADWAVLIRNAAAGDPIPFLKALIGWDWGWQSRLAYILLLTTTFAWPGVEVSNFNMMLEMIGTRGTQRGSTIYVAINSVAVAAGGIISGLFAAWLTKILTVEFLLPLPWLGIVLTYHGVLFLVAALLRLGAVGMAFKLHEPRAIATREAVQYMTEHLYSNVREAVLLPTRVIGRVARWSYKTGSRP